MKKINFLAKKDLWLVISSIVLAISLIIFAIFKFNVSAEFKQTTAISIRPTSESYTFADGEAAVNEAMESLGISNYTIYKTVDGILDDNIDAAPIHQGLYVQIGEKIADSKYADIISALASKQVFANAYAIDTDSISVENIDASYKLSDMILPILLFVLVLIVVLYLYAGFRFGFLKAITIPAVCVYTLIMSLGVVALVRVPVVKDFAYVLIGAILMSVFVTFAFMNTAKREENNSTTEDNYTPLVSANNFVNRYTKNAPVVFVISAIMLVALLVEYISNVLILPLLISTIICLIVVAITAICIMPQCWLFFANKQHKTDVSKKNEQNA